MTMTMDCPWCSWPVEVLDDDLVIACEACRVHTDLAPDEGSFLAVAA